MALMEATTEFAQHNLKVHGMVSDKQASLTVNGGPNNGATVRLSGPPITLGRRSDNDIVLEESSVSRRHALVMAGPAGFVVRDLNTTNGTYVNSTKIGQNERLLKHGDRIRLAGSPILLVFRQEGAGTVKMQSEAPSTGAIDLGKIAAPAVGEPEPAEPALLEKESALLRFLESKRGAVVSREEIARHVWGEMQEGNLANYVIDQSIENIRVSIENEPLKPVHLLTVGEFGYLFV